MGNIKFQTTVEIPKFKWNTGHTKKNLFIGSCFTENMGNKMAELKYDVDINPFGILYNPASVANGLKFLLKKEQLNTKDLIQYNGLWHSFFHHGKFSGADKKIVLKKINSGIQQSSEYLKTADFLFLTFGTAWIYEYKKTRKVVANCHKIPASKFKRRRLGVEEITIEYSYILPEIWKQNPECKVIFTVSPIRHWKDGAVENQRSKAALLLATDKITTEFGAEKCAYFPSYEIVMDELRDYRFFADDMIHISEVGINHIWNRFEESLIDTESIQLTPRIQKILKAYQHKPFNHLSKEYLFFLKTAIKQVKDLQKDFPNLNFELEKRHFMDKMNEIENKLEHF